MEKDFLTDEWMLQDVLMTEEYLSHLYQFCAVQAKSTTARQGNIERMNGTLELAKEIQTEMEKRGWAEAGWQADDTKIGEVQSFAEQLSGQEHQ